MSVKIGDTVRYLNAVGGGKVVRIADGIAYVDEDGFETPVLLRECVVVTPSKFETAVPKTSAKPKDVQPEKKETPAPTQLPIIETKNGNVLNLVLGFEPTNIKALSQSSFEAYIVNDSNYYIYISVSSRSDDSDTWTLRYDGLVEPNIQEFAFELQVSELAEFDRMSVQYIAFKRERDFDMKPAGGIEFKVDTTKFAKLHCFRPNPYFDGPVLAFDIAVKDKVPAMMPELGAAHIAEGIRSKKRDVSVQERHTERAAKSKAANRQPDIIEVDLHADELLDTTAGLSPADILNLQIDRFTEVMLANQNRPGQRIVFIHGKGEGILRQAIMKELTHRFKGHDVQDASFREYGFGATQVTIKPIAREFPPKDKKSRR